ncbi:helix-turn-helix transcriptional regulator [Actinospica durhamensis]|uniref:Helix-turn-helix transcriptional regulator n=1 Tax=Actinospica durhamensis TaxID=1508375 RepID=A0A941IVP7_9ACTN|nr:metalloregulator ArsR/SmtB family transcription factor [Actinospica durhamensis]MBR7839773.1 helix-turn-helix transcriptional regulator [Actinospica durhamensis]
MSNKELPALDVLAPACCSPMVREPLTEADAVDLAHVFKALADPIRLRLFSLIASFEGGQACVCDLTGPFDVSQPTISHHLRVLREAGLVDSERRGTWVYYWVLPDALARLSSLLAPAAATPATTAALTSAPAAASPAAVVTPTPAATAATPAA